MNSLDRLKILQGNTGGGGTGDEKVKNSQQQQQQPKPKLKTKTNKKPVASVGNGSNSKKPSAVDVEKETLFDRLKKLNDTGGSQPSPTFGGSGGGSGGGGANNVGQTIINVATTVNSSKSKEAIDNLRKWITATAAKGNNNNSNSNSNNLEDQSFTTVPLTKADDKSARDMLWKFHQETIKADSKRQKEMKDLLIEYEDQYFMPIWYTTNGPNTPPKGGRSLYVSLHGGGGSTIPGLSIYRDLNNKQWDNQKILYKSKNLPTEGIYCAPRAPVDAPDMWHQSQIDPMFTRLIENFVVFENVNPNRVYVLGYSSGGDGVYHLATRMSDRWAAAAAMAGHPGNAKPESVHSTAFTIQMGANDDAFQRNERAEQWKTRLAKLQQQDDNNRDDGGYDHWVEIYKGRGHNMMGDDAAALPWMAKRTRNIHTNHIIWKQDNVLHKRFYWLAVDKPKSGMTIIARRSTSSSIEIGGDDLSKIQGGVRVRLDDQMHDLDRKIRITRNGGKVVLYDGVPTRTIGVLYQTLKERGDPTGMFSSEIKVSN